MNSMMCEKCENCPIKDKCGTLVTLACPLLVPLVIEKQKNEEKEGEKNGNLQRL